jgi:hypothetical protein
MNYPAGGAAPHMQHIIVLQSKIRTSNYKKGQILCAGCHMHKMA